MNKGYGRRLLTAVIASLTLAIVSIALFAMTACSKWWQDLPKNARKFDYSAWNLDFSDEFDGNSLNTANWKINTFKENGQIRRAGYYVDDSDVIYVKDGNLVISTRYKNGALGEGWYTSWVESSVEKHAELAGDNYSGYATKHGYFEIRCIAPPSVGIWSAFWMMPDGGQGMGANDVMGTGSDGVEIDVMESPYMYQRDEKSLVTHVVHGDGYKDTTVSDKSPTYRVKNMYSELHTYGVEWNESEYIFYIDGIETWHTKHSDGKGGELGVSDVTEYMILSVEVGGTTDKTSGKPIAGKVYNGDGELEDFWSGNPDSNDKTKSYDFVVDYVRVYKAK